MTDLTFPADRSITGRPCTVRLIPTLEKTHPLVAEGQHGQRVLLSIWTPNDPRLVHMPFVIIGQRDEDGNVTAEHFFPYTQVKWIVSQTDSEPVMPPPTSGKIVVPTASLSPDAMSKLMRGGPLRQ